MKAIVDILLGVLRAVLGPKVLDFIGGKDPKIFDERGHIVHKFPEKKWQDWNARFKSSEFNWREHKGQKPKTTDAPTKGH